ncbi:DUF6173 family protein [Mesorhizobium sp. M0520]|uniref:DUF6173 family protein n=1 Tax=Mesorhizobium sp. M0520 TaxID=2956957 RepID=UPI00333C7CBC
MKVGDILEPKIAHSVSMEPIIHTIQAPRIPKSRNDAEWMYERIARSINEFEGNLDPDQEVGARLTTFGPAEIISIDDVGYWGPDMIIFYGHDSKGQPAQLLQHITQVSVMLVAVKVENASPRRIGFVLMDKLEGEGDPA